MMGAKAGVPLNTVWQAIQASAGNSWVVLFSHPADFTPVCTTELGKTAALSAEFAKRGVVLVAANYRVGRFGFFAFPALSRERPDEIKGNYAYMDQIAALQSVDLASIGSAAIPGFTTAQVAALKTLQQLARAHGPTRCGVAVLGRRRGSSSTYSRSTSKLMSVNSSTMMHR